MSAALALYRRVIVPAAEAGDGETPTVAELEAAGEYLVLTLKGHDFARVLGMWRAFERDRAIEQTVGVTNALAHVFVVRRESLDLEGYAIGGLL